MLSAVTGVPYFKAKWLTIGFLWIIAWSVRAQATTLEPYNLTAPFPAHFLYGTAVAGFQVDMGCPTVAPSECEDRASDWYAFITSPWTLFDPLLFLTPDAPTTGPGFYELYREDIKRAKTELASNAVRLSIEWSRIFPQATFGVEGYEALRAKASPEALAYYHNLIAQIRTQGMEPFVTVSHYTLPVWIHDAVGCHANLFLCYPKGWADPDMIVPEIAKYAGFLGHEFGHEVDYWATLNGPFASVVFSGYLFPSALRSNPPGVYLNAPVAKTAMRAMVEAHARMYDALRAEDKWSAVPGQAAASIGLVGSQLAVVAASAQPGDVQAAANMRYLINDMFLNAVANGDLDLNWDGHPVHRDDLSGRLDFIGLNYYSRVRASEAKVKLLGFISPLFTFDPTSGFDDFAPDGLYQVIAETAQYGRPIYVTETGLDAAPDAIKASNWLIGSLDATRRALTAGFDVRGYFYWSLIDNYEWNKGTKPHFGLFAVDPADLQKTRQARPAAAVFKEIGKAQRLPELKMR